MRTMTLISLMFSVLFQSCCFSTFITVFRSALCQNIILTTYCTFFVFVSFISLMYNSLSFGRTAVLNHLHNSEYEIVCGHMLLSSLSLKTQGVSGATVNYLFSKRSRYRFRSTKKAAAFNNRLNLYLIFSFVTGYVTGYYF